MLHLGQGVPPVPVSRHSDPCLLGAAHAVFPVRLPILWTMSSWWLGCLVCLRVKWRGLSAEERLDQGDEGCLVLEQEGVAGVGVEREFGSGDQAGEGVAVGERVELVRRAVGDERGDGDQGGLLAGRVASGPPLVPLKSTTCPP